MATVLAGCGDSTKNDAVVGLQMKPPTRRTIASLQTDKGFTARSVLDCAGGKCIVLHFPPGLMTDPFETESFLKSLQKVLIDRPDSSDDDGEILSSGSETWSFEQRFRGSLATFNCCTYALSDVLDLTTYDWISANPNESTEFTIPMKILLDSYFRLIHIESLESSDWEDLKFDPRFEDGDIFCYVRRGFEDQSFEGVHHFSHVGKILRRDGRNWLVSKLGMGPIVRSGLAVTGEMFSGDFDQIRVYRLKTNSM